MDAVGVVEGLGHLLRRLEKKVDGVASLPQQCDDFECVVLHVGVVRYHHEVDLWLQLRQQALLGQKLHEDAVAKAEAASGHVGGQARVVESQQLVVAPAAADGAQLAFPVKALEDDAGVVSEAAHDRCVEVEKVRKAVRLRLLKELAHVLDGLAARVADELLELLDRAQGERGDDLLGRFGRDLFLHEQLDHRVGADLVELVDDDADLGKLVARDAVEFQRRGEYFSRVDLDADVCGSDAERLEKGRDGR
mmetsp:Transcript_18327/g.39551  ORF Transcript_18327/g.39551 Transcript_18327/m.39551 type:complete len:250 (+) Transcript_18327:847-1596(+)